MFLDLVLLEGGVPRVWEATVGQLHRLQGMGKIVLYIMAATFLLPNSQISALIQGCLEMNAVLLRTLRTAAPTGPAAARLPPCRTASPRQRRRHSAGRGGAGRRTRDRSPSGVVRYTWAAAE